MLITRTAPPILDISLGTALTVDTLPVDVDMDKVKDIIGQLYEKGAV